MKFYLVIYPHFVRVVLILTFIGIIVSCEKEEALDSITPIPGWVVENLNEDYYIQFPINYSGGGFKERCFDKINHDKDIVVFQCYCDDYATFICVGDCLSVPLPAEITRIPTEISSSMLTLNNMEYLINKDSLISGILYFSDGFEIIDGDMHVNDGLYYRKINDNYISMLRVQYNTEKVDTIRMICNSIEKK